MIEKTAAELIRECMAAIANLGTLPESDNSTAAEAPVAEQEEVEESTVKTPTGYTGQERFTEMDADIWPSLQTLKQYDPDTYDRIQRWD